MNCALVYFGRVWGGDVLLVGELIASEANISFFPLFSGCARTWAILPSK